MTKREFLGKFIEMAEETFEAYCENNFMIYVFDGEEIIGAADVVSVTEYCDVFSIDYIKFNRIEADTTLTFWYDSKTGEWSAT